MDQTSGDIGLTSSEELRKVGAALRRHRMTVDPRVTPIVACELTRTHLTPSQMQIWLVDQIASAGALYNLSRAYRLKGPLNVDALKSAVRQLVIRHEILRARIEVNDGDVYMATGPLTEPLVEEWSGAMASKKQQEQEREVRGLIRTNADQPIDIVHGPMLRVIVVRMSDTDHILQVLLHHIVADLWSMGIFFHELGCLYNGQLHGETQLLPKVEVQYKDYSEWQHSWLDTGIVEKQIEFWRNKLSGVREILKWPMDRQRSSSMSFRGETVPVAIERELSASVCELARREQITTYMVLLAALQIVVARWSGQREFVIGCPIAGRNNRQLERVIGCFGKVIPLRAEWPTNGSLRDLFRLIKSGTLQAFSNPDVPLSKLTAELGATRRSKRHALVQVSLHFRNTPRLSFTMSGLSVDRIETPESYAHFDVTLSVWTEGIDLRCVINYSTDTLDRVCAERLGDALKTVLTQMAYRSDLKIDDIDVLTVSERRKQLVEWNASQAGHREEICVHELFEEQARSNPQAIAALWEEKEVSYGALNEKANQLAHRLRSIGVGPEAVVGICADHAIEALTGIIAVLKAGGAYLPLDGELPAERLAHMLDDSGCVAVLVQGSGVQALRRVCVGIRPAIRLIDLERDAARWEQEPRNNGQDHGGRGVRATNLAYVLYTSGSTGVPKGVMVEHGSVVNLLEWTQKRSPLRGHDRVLQRTPLNFDASVWELFWPLTVGAQLVLVRPGGGKDPHYLANRIGGAGVTVAQFVPAILEMFLQSPRVDECTRLRNIFCGGGELRSALAKRVHARIRQARLHNVYGPTEACVDSTAFVHDASDGCEVSSVPIGRPIANTRVYLLDDRLEPVPCGSVGEIYIGGVGVARGYLRRPGLTAQCFIASPFVRGDRLYKTGDLGRYRADGNIEFVGRNDFQVKIRGYRIELGEIEARLAEHPQVREVVVTARNEGGGGRQLVAYYTPAQPGIQTDVFSLRSHLAAALPEYMVPAAYVCLEALPLTSNGKLDREAFPPPGEEAYGSREYEPPEGAMETALAKIWAAVLGVERIGRRDNFFDLGGHSLLAVRVISKVRQELDLEVALPVLFNHPTLTEFSKSIAYQSVQ
jgi:arthrofactin-type cyclic lipopeptide synthetase C